MQLLDVIFSRRSIGAVRPDPLPRALIERLLEAAVQAPNHHRVYPWRFFVLSGPARERLGDVLAGALLRRNPQASPEQLEVERRRPLRAPLLIAVAVEKPEQPKVIEIENVCAVAAAVQNLLLAAHDLGLAAMWRTGTAAYDADVKDFLGLAPDQHLIAFVYLGYPLEAPQPVERPSHQERTVWLDEKGWV